MLSRASVAPETDLERRPRRRDRAEPGGRPSGSRQADRGRGRGLAEATTCHRITQLSRLGPFKASLNL